MKFLMLFFSVIAMAPQSFANSLTCEAQVLVAGSSGLVPVEQTIKLTPSMVQAAGNLDLKKCSSTTHENLSFELCILENTEAVGVYSAELLVRETKMSQDTMDFTTARNLMATARRGVKLVSLVSDSALSPIFIKKMQAARLKFPDYHGGDSLQIDRAIARAFTKKVLTKDDIVAIELSSCEF